MLDLFVCVFTSSTSVIRCSCLIHREVAGTAITLLLMFIYIEYYKARDVNTSKAPADCALKILIITAHKISKTEVKRRYRSD